MRNLIILSLALAISGAAVASPAKEEQQYQQVTITHLPANVIITKQCGNTMQTQTSNITSSESKTGSNYSYSYSSEMNMSSFVTADNKNAKATKDCTLIIRSAEPCSKNGCVQQVVDFNANATPATASNKH